MGKAAVKLSEVVYTVSPMRTGVLGGLFNDFGSMITKKAKDAVDAAVWFVVPTVAVYSYAEDFNEKLKQKHRY